MNKEVLVALIAKDVRELHILTEGIEQMNNIPAPYLRLASEKAESLKENIDNLIKYIEEKDNEKENIVREETERLMAEVKLRGEEKLAMQAAALKAAEEEEREAEERTRIEREAEEARIKAEADARQAREAEEKRIAAERETEERARIEREAEESRIKAEADARQARETEERRMAAERETEKKETEKPKTTVAESIKSTESLIDRLSKREDNTIGAALNNQKINDLKTAITIVDRFRFQRELFGGDGEKMNKSLSIFNDMEKMEDALAYIDKNLGWKEENEAVADFLQLLHRRYL